MTIFPFNLKLYFVSDFKIYKNKKNEKLFKICQIQVLRKSNQDLVFKKIVKDNGIFTLKNYIYLILLFIIFHSSFSL